MGGGKRSDRISDFLDFAKASEAAYQMAYEQVGKMDKRKCDLEHELELDGATREERSRIARQLRECLLERRRNKDIVEELTPIIDQLNDKQCRHVLEQWKQTLGKVRKAEDYHANRTYRRREGTSCTR